MTQSRRIPSKNFSVWLLTACAVALALLCARPARAQMSKHEQARVQYAKAEKLRAALDAEPAGSRTLPEYKKVVAAYREVYLLTASAPQTTLALQAVGQLYHDMGDAFDPQYYQSSLVTYEFLLSQYPTNEYRADTLFQIASIEKNDLHETAEAKRAFTLYLHRFPRGAQVADARNELRDLNAPPANATADATTNDTAATDTETPAARKVAEDDGSAASPNFPATSRSSDALSADGSSVTSIRTWNADDYTRVVVDLSGNVKYDSARINHPDRIYFDLYKAHLGHSLTDKELPVQNGFLKSVRVAQNKTGVVRLVLDVESIKGYSAFLLPDPYRLVIDVRGGITMASEKKTQPELGSGRLAGDQPAPHAATSTAPTETVEVRPAAPRSRAAVPNPRGPATGYADRGEGALAAVPLVAAQPMFNGNRSLTRALGLKIRRIVIDPGHGGYDTGTIGPDGVLEKNVCLDVALRLGRLIKRNLPGAKVIYTRKTDVFVPLEERTAIANQAHADLFISIHANSSHDPAVRGVETYYLNFTTSPEALETASRENALSNASINQLQGLIKKIARNDKIEESRQLAIDIQSSLTGQLRQVSTAERNRGVKKAPFVVLIGANMPSVLCEISFLSNPRDARLLEEPARRERIAEGIFRGVETYLSSLNSLNYDRHKPTLVSDRQSTSAGASRAQR